AGAGRQARSVGRNIRPLTCSGKSAGYQYGARNANCPMRRRRNRQANRPTVLSPCHGSVATEAENGTEIRPRADTLQRCFPEDKLCFGFVTAKCCREAPLLPAGWFAPL